MIAVIVTDIWQIEIVCDITIQKRLLTAHTVQRHYCYMQPLHNLNSDYTLLLCGNIPNQALYQIVAIVDLD